MLLGLGGRLLDNGDGAGGVGIFWRSSATLEIVLVESAKD